MNSSRTPAPSPVPPEQALVTLREWLSAERPRVAELTGPAGSGRTRVLRQVHEAAPDSVFIDATGLTSEDVIHRVLAAAGLDNPPERRADWGYALEESPLRGKLIVLANAQRAGRTRRSAEPDRMVHRFSGELAVAGVKVLVERDLPDVRRRHDHLVVALPPLPADESLERELPDGAAVEALRALALAEPRRVPMDVWAELGRAWEVRSGRQVDVAAASRADGLLDVDDEGRALFRAEHVADALRRSVEPELVRAVHRDVVEWLRGRAADGPVPTRRYLSQGLAMHAVQAGEFDAVQRSGRLVAHIDQVALIDAARADRSYVVNGDSPTGDAVNLWASGVDSLPQDEWASWLHLMSTVRGDHETAAEIAAAVAASDRQLPWRVRWAHWRPPGAVGAEFVRPGPLAKPYLAPEEYRPGRPTVIAEGEWNDRYQAWDVRTGEQVAGPWPDAVPDPGQREDLWLPDGDRDVTPAWVDLTVFDALEPSFVAGQVAVGEVAVGDAAVGHVVVGDVVVVAGLGGIFAVDVHPAADGAGLTEVHGEPMFDDPVWSPVPYDRAPQGDGLYAAGLFEPGVVRLLPKDRVPRGLTDTESLRVLTEAGLPAVEAVEMRLLALDEQGLAEADSDDLDSGEGDGDYGSSTSAYYRLGQWVTSDVVLNGSTGTVHLLGANDWVSDDEFDDFFFDEGEDSGAEDQDGDEVQGGAGLLIAGSLTAFVKLLQQYLVTRCMLASAGYRREREEIRDSLSGTLSEIDAAGAASGAWTTGFTETD
ncbi:SUKH-4 family immunity protein [Streptomyces boluensis]|uniref:Uncharacterized protein n=1 Tax=Streptomyces boluensis TaxID=1775135 RepID=A0A964XNE0_9ACTN|nr:SUKH-4 family immunity protein [Streptomyces boluensis]NBE53692.1 hypothetical protein [Streptomyces boluensis]